jgi:hypothetical protein
VKQSFWALNARHGRLDNNTMQETAALRDQLAAARKQLAEAGSGPKINTNVPAADNQQLHAQCENLAYELKLCKNQVQNEIRLNEQYQQDFQNSEAKLELELAGLRERHVE